MKTQIAIMLSLLLVSMTAVNVFAAPPDNCRFTTASATLNFGALDQSIGNDVTINASLIARCSGVDPITYAITDDDGIYKTGINANRMVNTTYPAQFIPYSLTYAPLAGGIPRNTNFTVTLTGVAKGVDYINAYEGAYTDTVILTINP